MARAPVVRGLDREVDRVRERIVLPRPARALRHVDALLRVSRVEGRHGRRVPSVAVEGRALGEASAGRIGHDARRVALHVPVVVVGPDLGREARLSGRRPHVLRDELELGGLREAHPRVVRRSVERLVLRCHRPDGDPLLGIRLDVLDEVRRQRRVVCSPEPWVARGAARAVHRPVELHPRRRAPRRPQHEEPRLDREDLLEHRDRRLEILRDVEAREARIGRAVVVREVAHAGEVGRPHGLAQEADPDAVHRVGAEQRGQRARREVLRHHVRRGIGDRGAGSRRRSGTSSQDRSRPWRPARRRPRRA